MSNRTSLRRDALTQKARELFFAILRRVRGRTPHSGNPLSATHPKVKHKRVQFELWLGIANLLLAAATAWLAYTNNALQKQSAISDENQRAVEATLQLQTFWNDLLDDATREKLLRVVTWIDSIEQAGDDPSEHVRWLAWQQRIIDPDAGHDVWIQKLVGAEITKDPAQLFHELMKYRSATLRVLNALQAVVNLRTVTQSPVTSHIIDDTYRDIIRYRLRELTPFVTELRAESPERKNVWLPLTTAFTTSGVWGAYPIEGSEIPMGIPPSVRNGSPRSVQTTQPITSRE